jgi:hypothetical protein
MSLVRAEKRLAVRKGFPILTFCRYAVVAINGDDVWASHDPLARVGLVGAIADGRPSAGTLVALGSVGGKDEVSLGDRLPRKGGLSGGSVGGSVVERKKGYPPSVARRVMLRGVYLGAGTSMSLVVSSLGNSAVIR